jgi:23S rRNA (uracil1939-C5)-methyltransferase
VTTGETAARDAGRRLELEVESVAVGGDGVAREPEGRVVFVPRTAPGDRIVARVTEAHASYLRARVEELLSPGRERVAPGCPCYGACGGCQLQHLSPGGQAETKRIAVQDALRRIGKVEVDVPPVWEAGPRLGYRNRVTLTLRRGPNGVRAGYHARGAPDRIVDVPDCPLAEAVVGDAWRALRHAWGEAARHLPGGAELRLTVRGSAAGRAALMVEGGRTGAPGEGRLLAGAVPALACLAWRPTGEKRRQVAGDPGLPESWQGFDLLLGPETFLQVNRRAAEALERSLDEGVGEVRGLRVVDLYAGVGTRALRWALRGAEAAACEVDAEAVASGREAAGRYGAPAELVAARVEDALDGLLPADLLVLNPPRQGLSRKVARALQGGGAARLVYVSCDPATLARDLGRLAGSWRLIRVEAFDAFPQTAHVETVAWLEAA